MSVRDDAVVRRPRATSTYFIAEKLLKRGSLLPVSAFVEESLRRLLGVTVAEDGEWAHAIRRAALHDRCAIRPVRSFDSSEEANFLQQVLPQLRSDVIRWALCQVPLGGLTGSVADAASGQRVDFVIAHPSGLQVVIEVDGAQHARSIELDAERDQAITAAGFDVLRIPAQEVRARSGPAIQRLAALLSTIDQSPDASDPIRQLVLACRRVHQIQVAVLSGLIHGTACGRMVKIAIGGDITQEVARIALVDLQDLLADIAHLYGDRDELPALDLVDSAADLSVMFGRSADGNTIVVEDAFLPFPITTEPVAAAVAAVAHPVKEACERLLRRIFGWSTFREGQFEAISRALGGLDSIVLLPTGSGKSIAFQLAALLRPGVCIVVDPILSLIDDQVENLRLHGIDRVTQVTSATDALVREEILSLLSEGEYSFCYVAPERFQSVSFRESLRTLTTHSPVSLIAIDEAHCVSEWGHDFRPAYLHLAAVAREYCACNGSTPPLMALTGTASRSVLKDVQRSLAIDDFEAIITPTTFNRPELRFQAIRSTSAEKRQRLLGVLQSFSQRLGIGRARFFEPRGKATSAGLVFCPHVNGDFGVVDIASFLSGQLMCPVPAYSGTAPRGANEVTWQARRREIATAFKRNRAPVMACTKAFGMGIDKPNIRYTVHLCLPSSIEAFYQEAGRAGRDGQPAECVLLVANDDNSRTKRLLDPNTEIKELHEVMDKVSRNQADDISRALWFHANAFEGPEIESEQVALVLAAIGDVSVAHDFVLAFSDDTKLPKEKALYRLVSVGAVEDYTIDYSKKRFHGRVAGATTEEMRDRLYEYIAAYQRQRAREAVRAVTDDLGDDPTDNCSRIVEEMITFVYDIVERGRRQALAEMLAACETGQDDAHLRRRILEYLGTAAFADAIEDVLSGDEAGLLEASRILSDVQSSIEASELRGQVARALEAYPDHPGLRLLRGVAEALCANPNESTVEENLEASARFATTKYGIEGRTVTRVILEIVKGIADRRKAMSESAVRGLVSGHLDSRAAARTAVKELTLPAASPAYERLFGHMHEHLQQLLTR